ncbi:NXPE family member 3-like [Engraulis encrasicolus]|uniref:NXPE family member 3-like n=1 Tax=Engraulis encrasicolus TaxID=184585 RepID=UPI002FD155CF
MCTIKWPGVLLPGTALGDMAPKNCCCEYRDGRTGLTWQCHRPKTLPCDALIYQRTGDYTDHFTPFEKKLMQGTQSRWLNGDKRQIKIISTNAVVGRGRNVCRAGLPTPVPAGFFYNDVWTSFVCATGHFQGADSAACLRNRHIHIIGDSTLLQWFHYLNQTIPTLKRLELHSLMNVGPHLAVDVENNIDVHHRAHGIPYQHKIFKMKMTSLQYIENLIDEMDGGPRTVLVFTMSAHFAGLPLSYFVHRVTLVRRAVVSLLRRAPQTKVIIKSPNTSTLTMHRSLWFYYMHYRFLRETFRDMGVYFLDVWQMTSCHYLTYDMHPKEVIIRNEVDLLLSFICPK